MATLHVEVLYLRQELDKLRRLILGHERERFMPVVSPEQLTMGLDAQHVAMEPIKQE